MRHSLGTAVFSGMVGVTFFGVFLAPVFSHVIMVRGATGGECSRLHGEDRGGDGGDAGRGGAAHIKVEPPIP
jgi:multidrug efflux pump